MDRHDTATQRGSIPADRFIEAMVASMAAGVLSGVVYFVMETTLIATPPFWLAIVFPTAAVFVVNVVAMQKDSEAAAK